MEYGEILTQIKVVSADIAEVKTDLKETVRMIVPRDEHELKWREFDRRILDLARAVETRIETKEYTLAHDAMMQRVTRLETGPQRSWAIAGVIAGLGAVIISAIVGFFTVAGIIFTVIWTTTR